MKNIKLSTQELTEALAGNDMNRKNMALKSLYMSPVVNGTIREWVKSYQVKNMEADDILQEGIIKLDALIRAEKFRFESKVETFLLGICKNIIRDNHKKIDRIYLKETFTDEDLKDADSVADILEVKEQNAAEALMDERFRQAMGSLTPNCQESLKLYYWDSMNMAQVAEARGLANFKQAKKAVDRCRQALRDLLNV